MLCSEWSLVKQEFEHDTVIPLRCRCWHCDECRPLRTSKLIQEALTGLPTVFITLTSKRRPGITADQAARELARAWAKARALHMRKHGKGSLPFLAVFERTKKGWPHIHIVARCKWLDQRWLSRQMDILIGSPIVWVKRVHGKSKITAYVTKYISKDPHRFPSCKRYWRSLDYLTPPHASKKLFALLETPWQIWRMHWTMYADLSEGPKCRVEREKRGAEIYYGASA